MSQDAQLIERIQAGESSAFDELYRSCAPALLRRLVRMTGDRQVAEDCLQKVFMKAYRTCTLFRAESSLMTWLNRIATHTVIDVYRKQDRIRGLWERIVEKDAMLGAEAPSIPDEWLDREQTRKLVWEAMNQLSPHKRMALMLCELEGYSIEAAAKEVGVPAGTMASRVYHGRRELQEHVAVSLQRQGLSVGDLFCE